MTAYIIHNHEDMIYKPFRALLFHNVRRYLTHIFFPVHWGNHLITRKRIPMRKSDVNMAFKNNNNIKATLILTVEHDKSPMTELPSLSSDLIFLLCELQIQEEVATPPSCQ